MIQFDLFPRHGFGLLCFGELLVDGSGAPFFTRSRRTARKALGGLPDWMAGAAVVAVTIHNGESETPTYVIGGAP